MSNVFHPFSVLFTFAKGTDSRSHASRGGRARLRGEVRPALLEAAALAPGGGDAAHLAVLVGRVASAVFVGELTTRWGEGVAFPPACVHPQKFIVRPKSVFQMRNALLIIVIFSGGRVCKELRKDQDCLAQRVDYRKRDLC